MKIIAKPIDMIATFSSNRNRLPIPFKFRYETRSGERSEIRVDRIISTEKRKRAGTDSIVYTCQSQINGELHLYELKYIIGSYYWELYKI